MRVVEGSGCLGRGLLGRDRALLGLVGTALRAFACGAFTFGLLLLGPLALSALLVGFARLAAFPCAALGDLVAR